MVNQWIVVTVHSQTMDIYLNKENEMSNQYVMKDGTVIEYDEMLVPEDLNNSPNLVKGNLSPNLSDYESGNGEGVWILISNYDLLAYKGDVKSGHFIGKLLNGPIYYPHLSWGDYVLFEWRGQNRPVAVFEELQKGE